MSNDTRRLFGLVGVEVVGVEVGADGIPMLALVTFDEQPRWVSPNPDRKMYKEFI